MEKDSDRRKLAAMLHMLSPLDRTWLLHKLVRDGAAGMPQDSRMLHPRELLAAETWLWDRAQKAATLRERQPRIRVCLIFLLLRYAALRLVEIFTLQAAHMDFAAGIVRVPGAGRQRGRTVPLPLAVARRLRRLWEDSGLFSGEKTPLCCDASHVRRSLQQCGAACGLPKGLLNARTLRRTRALELERRGLPPSVINIFLGRAQPHTGGARFAPETAARMLHEQIQGEQCMKTSARNVFQGRIVELARHGLLTHVALRTAEGLRVTAVITNESDKALGLTEGALVNASVKAPWVMLLPGALPDSASAPAENCYTGIVERIREDGMVAEVLVALPEGMMICALCGKGTELPRGLAQGQTVTAYFKSFSVILTLE